LGISRFLCLSDAYKLDVNLLFKGYSIPLGLCLEKEAPDGNANNSKPFGKVGLSSPWSQAGYLSVSSGLINVSGDNNGSWVRISSAVFENTYI